ncbi:thioredoxin-dependent thiol peroxidase [Luteipulveratus sp. YIM 133132]|uniref:thioredoxin-dependent thiol peroxidase n=1 Tax=Luteipulveratus flavus TaxID=3031728 RepID=UPI0023AF7529|nr:thioredoxin-dependent thiol peroxidase [Luteipulveratus sp. YIM 133132]MDE9366312.1 thioredoxin-dependent thiol peroxidase [Luteipulveratus sp. YIM 133132]
MPRLETGDIAPDFTLQDSTGGKVSLGDFRGRKLVIFFYPAAMTPGCTKEACDFRDSLSTLRDAGYDVIGISPDVPEKLARFTEQEALTYPLLSDPDKQVLEAYGAYGEKKLYGKTITGVIRSTIVLDEDGVVVLPKYNVRATGHVAALSKALKLA